MVGVYRQAPGNANVQAARAAGVDFKTAQKAWRFGWPGVGFRAICDVIAEEQLELRARMVREKDRADTLAAELEAKRRLEVKQAAITDATETSKQELQMVRLARGASVQTLATITNVAAGAAKVGQQVRQALDRMATVDPDTGLPRALTTREASDMMRLLSSLTGCLRQANEAARSAIEMERVLAGEPTHVVGHVVIGPMSMAEAEERISRASRALERAKRDGVVFEAGPLTASLPAPGGDGTNGSGNVH